MRARNSPFEVASDRNDGPLLVTSAASIVLQMISNWKETIARAWTKLRRQTGPVGRRSAAYPISTNHQNYSERETGVTSREASLTKAAKDSDVDWHTLQIFAAMSSARQAKRAVTAAWASVIINSAVVIVAVWVPYSQQQVAKRAEDAKSLAERKLLISEIRRIRNDLYPFVFAASQTEDNDLGGPDADANVAVPKIRAALARIDLIEARFALDADTFAATSQARAALNQLLSGAEAKAALEKDRSQTASSALWADVARGFVNLSIITNMNDITGGANRSYPIRLSTCETDYQICRRLFRTFELIHRHVYGSAEMKGEATEGRTIPESEYVSHPNRVEITLIP